MQHIPFDYDNKPVFGAKVAAYLITGFAVPFVAAYYQLSVSILYTMHAVADVLTQGQEINILPRLDA